MAKWIISVGGYGTFFFEGTESEAEEMRAHKAKWERGVGKKRPADDEEVASGMIKRCLNHPGYLSKNIYNDCQCPDMDCVANAYERLGVMT